LVDAGPVRGSNEGSQQACRHEKLVPELYAGQHGKHQECSVCGASRVNYETGEIGFALSKVTKWSEWSLV